MHPQRSVLPLLNGIITVEKCTQRAKCKIIDSPGYLPSKSRSISSIADFGRLRRQTGGSPASRRPARSSVFGSGWKVFPGQQIARLGARCPGTHQLCCELTG
jgi:hypothetical protein